MPDDSHAQYLASGHDSGSLFLNVDPSHVLSVPRDHGRYFEDVLHRCGLGPQRIVIQVRDKRVRREELYCIAAALGNYRAKGYGVAAVIEDSVVSHAGLDRLWRLPPDLVKLDRSFLISAIRSAWQRHRYHALVSIIHHLAACRT